VWSPGVRDVINDGLMALFFFVLGLEIRRELTDGQLATARAAAVPALGALGGMVLPALIYLAVNRGGPGVDGWGIPTATDVAFSLGVLALLARRVPPGLKVLLLGLAIVDDIGAIVVIAVFYAHHVALGWLAVAGLGLAVVALVRRPRLWSLPLYLALGVGVWFATLQSGVHATIAGVALGLLAPTTPVAERLEDALHPWTSYAIVPLFALANAGVRVTGGRLGDALTSRVTLGVAAGLVVGKLVGVAGAITLGTRLGLGELPPGVGRGHVVGVAALAGIGFTVSLFITGLAFDTARLADQAKIGILAASVIAALVGAAILAACSGWRWSGRAVPAGRRSPAGSES
jgi:NhaA family Na+:H+ antiporter